MIFFVCTWYRYEYLMTTAQTPYQQCTWWVWPLQTLVVLLWICQKSCCVYPPSFVKRLLFRVTDWGGAVFQLTCFITARQQGGNNNQDFTARGEEKGGNARKRIPPSVCDLFSSSNNLDSIHTSSNLKVQHRQVPHLCPITHFKTYLCFSLMSLSFLCCSCIQPHFPHLFLCLWRIPFTVSVVSIISNLLRLPTPSTTRNTLSLYTEKDLQQCAIVLLNIYIFISYESMNM